MDFPSISWSFSVSGSFTGSWGFINSPSFSGAPGRRSGVSRGAVEENMDELIWIYIYIYTFFNIDIYIYAIMYIWYVFSWVISMTHYLIYETIWWYFMMRYDHWYWHDDRISVRQLRQLAFGRWWRGSVCPPHPVPERNGGTRSENFLTRVYTLEKTNIDVENPWFSNEYDFPHLC